MVIGVLSLRNSESDAWNNNSYQSVEYLLIYCKHCGSNISLGPPNNVREEVGLLTSLYR